MRDIQMHDAFVPQGCEGHLAPTPAVSLGAGCRWVEAYDAVTTKAGRYVQGGGCTSVGVAGLVQGGGFGSFSKRYGTGASNLLEAEIVTADGVVRMANPRSNPDLFWAIRGGGGGSFGVVTRLTLETHEAPKIGGGFEVTIKANSDESFRRLIAAFVELYADGLNDAALGRAGAAINRNNTLARSPWCSRISTTRRSWRRGSLCWTRSASPTGSGATSSCRMSAARRSRAGGTWRAGAPASRRRCITMSARAHRPSRAGGPATANRSAC